MLRDGGGDRRPGLRRDARSLDRRNCGTPVRWSGWVAWKKDRNAMIACSDAEVARFTFDTWPKSSPARWHLMATPRTSMTDLSRAAQLPLAESQRRRLRDLMDFWY
jgi:hypothetical protein